ncbi:cysteinyl leukotriene receptor 2 [Menidia menidia]
MSGTGCNSSNVSRELLSCSHDDDEFKYRAYTVTYLLVFPVALLCNAGALLVFTHQALARRGSSRGSSPCVVMMNLALSDGGFSLTLPLRLAYYFGGGQWLLPDWLCRLCVFGFYVNLYSSILLLTLLSVLRWRAVVHPLRSRAAPSPRQTLLMCAAIWVVVAAASVPFLSQGVTCRNGRYRCFEPPNQTSWGRILILNYVGLVLGFLLPFCTIISCYAAILRRLSGPFQPGGGRAAGRKHAASARRSGVLISMVTATFLLCFLPYHLLRTLHLHAVCGGWGCALTRALQRAVAVTLCLAASNSVVNPLLYYYSTHTFRTTIRNTQESFRSRSSRAARHPDAS